MLYSLYPVEKSFANSCTDYKFSAQGLVFIITKIVNQEYRFAHGPFSSAVRSLLNYHKNLPIKDLAVFYFLARCASPKRRA